MRARALFPLRVDLEPNPPKEICYLFHLDPPLEHAKHYLGSSEDFDRRDGQHGTSHGARILQVQKQRGGSWHLVRTWEGSKKKERQLKTRSGALYCPECTEHPLPGMREPRQGARYLTRRQREEAKQKGLQEKEDFYADMHAEELTYSETSDRLTLARPQTDAEMEAAIPYIEKLEAGWLREKQESEMSRSSDYQTAIEPAIHVFDKACQAADAEYQASDKSAEAAAKWDQSVKAAQEEIRSARELTAQAWREPAKDMSANHRSLGADTATQLVVTQAEAGVPADRIREKQEDIAAGLWSRAEKPQAEVFAREYDWTAQALGRDLEELEAG